MFRSFKPLAIAAMSAAALAAATPAKAEDGVIRIGAEVKPGDIRRSLPEHPPAIDSAAEPFEAILADLDQLVMPGITHWQHPSFFAYFPGNTSYPAILGDLAASGLGVQGMSWVTSPACTEVETLMMDWMQELLGLPEAFRSTSPTGGGVIQGSASEATLCSILAARWRATGGAVNNDGDTSRLVAYSTSQSHSSIEKGLRIAGIGTQNIRFVPHDHEFAMRVDELERMVQADIAAGLVPFWVCANRGTTSSLAFDDVSAIAKVAMLFTDLTEAGVNLRMMNLGGGFPTRYRDDVPEIDQFGQAIMDAMTAHFGNNLPEIVIEPGRFVVGDAGVISTEVVLVSQRDKNSPVRWVYLDIGRFGGLAETEGESIKYRIATPHDGTPTGPVSIAGPTCDGADIMYEKANYRLPLALRSGEIVQLMSTGAYVTTYASQKFNGFAPLAEYYI